MRRGESAVSAERVATGRIIAALLRKGWRPPPLSEEQRDDLLYDMETVTPNASLRLTERELAVLTLVAEGLTFKECGECLSIHTDTVKDRLDRVRLKLGARNTTHAVAQGIREGVIA